MAITDPKYRKGNLLMNFLRKESKVTSIDEYKAYLSTFLEEGDKFNGTNIWLGNIHGDLVFAHNQESDITNFRVQMCEETIAFGNGRCSETWFKQKLG